MPLQPRSKTKQRYKVCARTLERWEKNPVLNFPKPTIINGRKYDDEAKLDIWDREMAGKAASAASAA